MTLSYETLRDLNLDKLYQATAWWQQTRTLLADADNAAQDKLRPRLLSGEWEGDSARAGWILGFETLRACTHASRTATMTHRVLSDLYTALTDCQQRLRSMAAEAREKGLTVDTDGRVGIQPVPEMCPDVPRGPVQSDADEIAADIAAILAEARGYDEAAGHALDEIAGDGDGDRFTLVNATDLERAMSDVGEAAAEEAVSLIKGGELDDRKLDELNQLFALHRDNEAFAEALVLGLGPEAALDFWASLVDPYQAPADRSEGFSDGLHTLQEHFGVTVGLATRSDSNAMRTWEDDVIALGARPVGDTSGPVEFYGFQVMSNLMMHGEYRDGFLDDYAEALFTAEQENPQITWSETTGGIPPAVSDHAAFHLDPVTGLMTAFGNNPAAATGFFSEREDDDPRNDAAAYFLTVRDYPVQPFETNPDTGYSYAEEALGEAFRAAATGVSTGDFGAGEPEVTSEEEQRASVDYLLSMLADEGDDLPPAYRQPMASALIHHDDALYDSTSAPIAPRSEFDYLDLRKVLPQVFRDNDAHVAVNEALNEVTLERVRDPDQGEFDGPAEEDGPEASLRAAGRTVGYLERMRYEALTANQDDPTWTKHGIYHSVGSLVNLAPGFGDVAQRSVDAISSAWLEDEERRLDEELTQGIDGEFTAQQERLNAIVREWSAVHLDLPPGGEPPNSWYDAVGAGAVNGYGLAHRGNPG